MPDMGDPRPLILCSPAPRSIDMIFTDTAKTLLYDRYRIVDVAADALAAVPDAVLGQVRYVLGQPPISDGVLERMTALRAVLNVEGNLIANMPYDILFQRGIHTLTAGAVFAEPVAEIGLALALNLLARDGSCGGSRATVMRAC
jgi:phosphoglycerate dehydrogenase-like enzyme